MRRRSCLAVSTAAAVVAVLLLAAGASGQDTSHSSHDSHDSHDESSHEAHGGEEEGPMFQAAAVYDVGAGTNYLVTVPAGAESLEVETLAFMVVPAASADVEGLEGAEENAEAAWDAYSSGAEQPTVLTSGESAAPSADVVYQIGLAEPLAVVPVNVSAAGAHAVFLEHGSEEVASALVSPAGVVLVAAAEEGGEEEEEEEEEEEGDDSGSASASQWFNGMAASILVSACSFTGLLVVIDKRVARSIGLSHAFIFASGALLTASLLHIVPEALEGLEEKYDSLHDLGLYAGVAILGGLSFSVLIHALLESGHSHGESGGSHSHAPGGVVTAGGPANRSAVSGVPQEEEDDGDDGMIKAPSNGSFLGELPKRSGLDGLEVEHADMSATQPPTPAGECPSTGNLKSLIAAREGRSLLDLRGLQPVCWNVIAGDLVHNFADGVTIGAAFLSCSATIGWTVTASAVLHEVPHELADFMALLNGGMSVKQAFLYNFLSALSAVLGTAIILALGSSLSDAQVSIVLLLGAGSFIFIALSELLPEALSVSAAARERGGLAAARAQLLKLGSFVVGALLIGVPLIFDQHCSAGHDGHDH